MDKDKIKKASFNYFEQKNSQPTLFSLSDFGNKKVEVQFTSEQISSDGGLLFLKEVDKNIGLIDRIANCLEDKP
ncbi:MAG: transposase [Bacteroidales bacterium]|jgi:hypothetical protein|nr:transposase [Bacteroidales bacterium]MDD3701205.1 transposase [Bacteroidales bacterium]